MIDRLLPSCTEAWQHEQLLKLKFLLSRGFNEFPKLYLLKHNLINSMARELIDDILEEKPSRMCRSGRRIWPGPAAAAAEEVGCIV